MEYSKLISGMLLLLVSWAVIHQSARDMAGASGAGLTCQDDSQMQVDTQQADSQTQASETSDIGQGESSDPDPFDDNYFFSDELARRLGKPTILEKQRALQAEMAAEKAAQAAQEKKDKEMSEMKYEQMLAKRAEIDAREKYFAECAKRRRSEEMELHEFRVERMKKQLQMERARERRLKEERENMRKAEETYWINMQAIEEEFAQREAEDAAMKERLALSEPLDNEFSEIVFIVEHAAESLAEAIKKRDEIRSKDGPAPIMADSSTEEEYELHEAIADLRWDIEYQQNKLIEADPRFDHFLSSLSANPLKHQEDQDNFLRSAIDLQQERNRIEEQMVQFLGFEDPESGSSDRGSLQELEVEVLTRWAEEHLKAVKERPRTPFGLQYEKKQYGSFTDSLFLSFHTSMEDCLWQVESLADVPPGFISDAGFDPSEDLDLIFFRSNPEEWQNGKDRVLETLRKISSDAEDEIQAKADHGMSPHYGWCEQMLEEIHGWYKQVYALVRGRVRATEGKLDTLKAKQEGGLE